MLEKTTAIRALCEAFSQCPVAEIDDLFRLLETRSRTSVIRRLDDVGYRTSFTHGGRYYTLAGIPRFDENGLWFRQGIGFSIAGTLIETVARDVHASDAGRTHRELERRLRVRVHNTLLALVRDARIDRERLGGAYLYVSADTNRAAAQVARRDALLEAVLDDLLSPESTVEVLVEILRGSDVRVGPPRVAERLAARGIPVSTAQVEEVFARAGLDNEGDCPHQGTGGS